MHLNLIAFILIIIVISIVLIYLLFEYKQKNKIKTIKVDEDIKKIRLDDIRFPRNIEKMNFSSSFQACKVILDSYKALDYFNRPASVMDRIEWHTWQVSILLNFLKINNRIHTSNSENLLHKSILELEEKIIEQEIQKIFSKYIENANIEKDRDTLSKDVIWSAREVSIILYKILNN